MGRSILIASGKGGVGKSTFASGLARALSDRDQKVCLMDLDVGLRGQDTFLGVQDRIVYDVLDVLEGTCAVEKALLDVNGHGKLFLLAAPQFARAKDLDAEALGKLTQELMQTFDFVILDCPAGIERGLRGPLKASIDVPILLVTPDDLCLRDAERVCQVMEKKKIDRPVLVVNRLIAPLVERGEMYSAKTCAEVLDLHLLGEIPDDSGVLRAQLGHFSFMDVDCPAMLATDRIARRVMGEPLTLPDLGKRRPWYQRMWDVFLEPAYKEVKRIDR